MKVIFDSNNEFEELAKVLLVMISAATALPVSQEHVFTIHFIALVFIGATKNRYSSTKMSIIFVHEYLYIAQKINLNFSLKLRKFKINLTA